MPEFLLEVLAILAAWAFIVVVVVLVVAACSRGEDDTTGKLMVDDLSIQRQRSRLRQRLGARKAHR